MLRQSSHAHAPPPNEPPPNTFASETSPRQAETSVDPTTPVYDDSFPEPVPSRLADHPGKERRKFPDSTKAPDPREGYRGPVAMVKPDASKGFRPINNFSGTAIANRHNPAYGRSRHTTYGKTDRVSHAANKSIGERQSAAQQDFTRRKTGYNSQTSPSRSSPTKRRKVEHLASVDNPTETVYEIGDSEDEVQHAAPPRRARLSPKARSIVSSQSPHSVTSRQSAASAKPPSQPRSEFQETDEIFRTRRHRNPRRKTPNGLGEGSRAFQMNVPPLSAGQLSRGQSVEVLDSDGVEFDQTQLVAVESFEQGISHASNDRNQPQERTGVVTSTFFAPKKMRINESTAEVLDTMAALDHGKQHMTKNLREFRAAGSNDVEVEGVGIEYSEDELAPPTSNTSKSRTKKSPSKIVHGNKRMPRANRTMGKIYQLGYVRTYNLESKGEPLILEETENPNNFRITSQGCDGESKVLQVLNLASVNKITQDNTHNMRLTGPAARGNIYWFDLSFTSLAEFLDFRDKHVFPEVAEKAKFTKAQAQMIELFQHPFKLNNKIGSTSVVDEQVLPANGDTNSRETAEPSSLTGKGTTIPIPDGLRPPPAPRSVQARAIRATRATAPIHTQSEEAENIVKYSTTTGLGKRWDKQLEFNLSSDEGFLKRRRCTVDFNDLYRLDEGEMLNDALINFDLLYMYDNLKVPNDRVYFFSTQFFEALTTNTKARETINYDAVKNWTKRDDIFSYDHLVVPIHEGAHWYLAIIYNVSAIVRKPAVEDIDDSTQPSQHTASLETKVQADQEDDRPNAQPQDGRASENPTTVVSVDNGTTYEDENLFEEEKLSLIDRDEDSGKERQASIMQDQPEEQTSKAEAETADFRPAAIEQDSSHPLHVPQPKRKTKRKPTAPKKDPTKPGIIILDSIAYSTHPKATRALREWLQAEGLQKRGMAVEIDNKGYYAKDTQIPMQTNYCDCGLYLLGYTRQFYKNPDDFIMKLLTGGMSADADWPNMQPSKMRHKMREILVRLYADQKESLKAKKAAKARGPPTTEAKANVQKASPTLQDSGKVESVTLAQSAERPSPDTTHVDFTTTAAARPRLASPFDPKSQDGSVSPEATENTVEGSGAEARTELATPEKKPDSSSGRSKTTPVRRRESPEVRVVKSPHIDTTSYVRYNDEIGPSTHPAQPSTEVSSLRIQEPCSEIGGDLRKPSEKELPSSSLARSTREKAVRSSPVHSRTRSGSHDDPIPLDDSQDLDVMTQKLPKTTKKSPPEIIELDRSQDTVFVPVRRAKTSSNSYPKQRSPRQQSFQHTDSFQEITGYEWQEGNDLIRAKSASLNDISKQGNQKANEPKVDRVMIDVDDSQILFSQSSHTLQEAQESQNMDVDDEAVPETPEHRRSSPCIGADAMEWEMGPVVH